MWALRTILKTKIHRPSLFSQLDRQLRMQDITTMPNARLVKQKHPQRKQESKDNKRDGYFLHLLGVN